MPFPRASGTADVSVRPAGPQDAADIARVQAVTWRTAYRSVLRTAVLDEWDEAAAAATWQAAGTSPPTAAHGVVVAVERDVVGDFAPFGPDQPPHGDVTDPAGPTTEVSTLLVEPRWGRR